VYQDCFIFLTPGFPFILVPQVPHWEVSLLSSTNSKPFFAEMLKMQFMEGMVMIMASVGFVWSSPGLMAVGVGGPAVGGMVLLQEDLISEFLFQDFRHQAAGRT